MCYAVLVLNAINLGYMNVNERLAWELSQFNIETKYLSNFLKGLKYIGSRIPEEGQSERLMLKYYNYLWEIRRFLKTNFNIDVLRNLERFPLNTDTLDVEYYEMVASSICAIDLSPKAPRTSRYYIQKKTPFFVNGERYFEITLQLAGLYATKFNRITVYSKQNISTNYSIQIAYADAEINLWGAKSKIKVLPCKTMKQVYGMRMANQTYLWERLGCFNYAPTFFGTSLPEVVNIKENDDGTVTLTVDAVCDMVICDDAVYVLPGPEGEVQISPNCVGGVRI